MLRFLFQTVLLWILTKVFGRFIPVLRRGINLFR